MFESFALLAELSSDECKQLEDFLEPRQYEDGRTLFSEYDEGDELVLITEGTVRLLRGKRELGMVYDGAALGGLSLVRIGERICTAKAVGAVSTLALTRESYLRLRGDYPQLALSLQEGLIRQLSSAAERAFR